MARKRLLWQLFPPYLLILLTALVVVTWFATRSFKDFYLKDVAADLASRARLAECRLGPLISAGDRGAIERACRECGERSATRITIIRPDGVVLGDSMKDPALMDNHADRPEVREALSRRTGSSIRYSHTLKRNMMYVAVPMESNGEVIAVIRAALPLKSVAAVLGSVYRRTALAGLVVALLAAAVVLAVSRRITRPLEEIREGADRFAQGELSHRLAIRGSSEIAGLALAMNEMAEKLDERIRTVERQRNEIEAVLSGMAEGVIAVDESLRLIKMNGAAARMVGAETVTGKGRMLQEVTRSTELTRFAERAMEGDGMIEDDLFLGEEGERIVQAHGTALRDGEGARIGALVVLNDVTHLRRLERVRRDFVANVSHELKTPVTTIKGFVETLLESAPFDPDENRRFLEIVARHAERLEAIIEDLLRLSRIEEETEKGGIPLEEGPLADVLREALDFVKPKAAEKGIPLEFDCIAGLRARMNTHLLRQAVVNLLDNAIKYSPPGKAVRLEGAAEKGGCALRVRDEGCGIAAEHLPRIFERFYRVDKARSREEGGTGLGLAIAKHIAELHGGRIEVASRPGSGSVFTILLPGAV